MMVLAAGRVPRPSCSPLGTMVCEPAAAPGCRSSDRAGPETAVRRALNPVVLALARLLAMLSMLICWAFMPLPALYSALIMCSWPSNSTLATSSIASAFMSVPSEIGLLQHLELPHDADQLHGRFRDGDVRLFELSLHALACRAIGAAAVLSSGREVAAAQLAQRLRH